MPKSLEEFVNGKLTEKEEVESHHIKFIQDVIRSAIDFYNLHSYEEVEGADCFLYIYSMAEENLLGKIIELCHDGKEELSLEEVYKGQIIRKY